MLSLNIVDIIFYGSDIENILIQVSQISYKAFKIIQNWRVLFLSCVFLPERYLYPPMQIPSQMKMVSWFSHSAWILKGVFLIWFILSQSIRRLCKCCYWIFWDWPITPLNLFSVPWLKCSLHMDSKEFLAS